MKDLSQEIMEAMKLGLSEKLSVLRALKTEMTNLSCQKGRKTSEVTADETIAIIRKMLKQRKESADLFFKGGREELAAKELRECEILQDMLPAPLSEIQLIELVLKALAQSGATCKREMGKAMKVANEMAAGRVDSKTLSAEVMRQLQD